jgi:hypothetical protein
MGHDGCVDDAEFAEKSFRKLQSAEPGMVEATQPL